jgi:multimeric flavodoxin WrbA
MKVLAIIGSPKKGNTYKITHHVEQRLRLYVQSDDGGEGALEFDYLFLKDADLGLCKGCFLCIPKGEDRCPLKDNRAEIEKRILASDGIILATPVYSMNVSWLMKNFMDRFAYTLHRPRFVKQKLMLVATAGNAGKKETLKSLGFTLGGAEQVSKLGVSTPPYRYRPRYEAAIARDVDKATRKFYRALRSGGPLPPTFSMVLWFQAFKTVSEKTRDDFPADHAFYKDKKDFFYDTRVSPIKTSMAKFMIRFLLRGMDKNFFIK